MARPDEQPGVSGAAPPVTLTVGGALEESVVRRGRESFAWRKERIIQLQHGASHGDALYPHSHVTL